MNSLKCLYYPYSRPISIASLKKAIMLFDVIGVIDSQPPAIRAAITREKNSVVTPEVAEDINAACYYLAQKGAIEVIDPTDTIKKYGSTLTKAIIEDIQEDDFCKFSISADFQIWTVLRERLPPEFLRTFYAGAGTFSEAVSLQAIIHTNGTLDGIPDHIKKFTSFRHPNLDPAKAWAYFLRRYKFVVGGNPHIELPAYQLPFLQASSLRINEALIIANDSEWVPFTDSVPHHNMLEMKIARGRAAILGSNDMISTASQMSSAAQLSVGILDEFIKDADFEHISFEDLLHYRENNETELKNFRAAILSMSERISHMRLSRSSANTTAAQLALAEVRQSSLQVRRNWHDFLQRLGIRVGLAAGPAAMLAEFGDIGFTGVLLAAGTAAAVALNSKGPDDLIRVVEANKSAKAHNFCYLTKFPSAGK